MRGGQTLIGGTSSAVGKRSRNYSPTESEFLLSAENETTPKVHKCLSAETEAETEIATALSAETETETER